MNRMPFEPIKIYFSDLRSSAGVRQAIARVFTDCTTGVIQAVHRLGNARIDGCPEPWREREPGSRPILIFILYIKLFI